MKIIIKNIVKDTILKSESDYGKDNILDKIGKKNFYIYKDVGMLRENYFGSVENSKVSNIH